MALKPPRNLLKPADGTCHCWNCDQTYQITSAKCPSCQMINANVDLEGARQQFKARVEASKVVDTTKDENKADKDPKLEPGYGVMSSI